MIVVSGTARDQSVDQMLTMVSLSVLCPVHCEAPARFETLHHARGSQALLQKGRALVNVMTT